MGNHQSKDSGSGESSNSTHVCDKPAFDTVPTDPILGSYDFHHLNIIISGACAAFSIIMLITLMFRHATHFSKPREQAEILRISSFIPIYAAGTFILVCAPTAYVYLWPWLEVAQAFALASFFLLLCRLLSSETDSNRDVFLTPMRLMQAKSGDTTVAAVSKYRRAWIFIYQYPIVAILAAIFTDITQAANVYCYGSHQVYFAALWLEILTKTSMGVAVVAVVKTYSALSAQLSPHRALPKLLAFKMLIGLQFVQSIVYMILQRLNPSPLTPTSKMSYTDMQIGIPLLLISCELVIFSVFFHFAYSVTPYLLSSYAPKLLDNADGEFPSEADNVSYRGGPLGIRAWASIFNPMELIAAVRFSFNMRSEALLASRNSVEFVSQPPAYNNTSYGTQ